MPIKRTAADGWWRTPSGVLTRLEYLGWRAWAVAIATSPRFAVYVVIIGALCFVSLMTVTHALVQRPVAAGTIAAIAGFIVYRCAYMEPGSPQRRALMNGVFHPWTGFGRVLEQWCQGRAIALTMVGLAVLAVPILSSEPVALPAFLVCAAAGATAARLTQKIRLPVLHLKPLAAANAHASWLSGTIRHVVRIRLRRRDWLWAIGLWIATTGAAALAVRNNAEPAVGFFIASFGGAMASLMLVSPDLLLLRFLGHQPIGLGRLCLTLYAPALAASAALAIVAGFASTLPPGLALASAVLVIGITCLWLGLLIPHGLTRPPRSATAFATLDIALAIVVKSAFLFGALAVVWLAGKLAWNLRMAGRRRWKDDL